MEQQVHDYMVYMHSWWGQSTQEKLILGKKKKFGSDSCISKEF